MGFEDDCRCCRRCSFRRLIHFRMARFDANREIDIHEVFECLRVKCLFLLSEASS